MAISDTTVFSVHAPSGAPDVSYPQPERRIDGNPRRERWDALDGPLCDARQISAGVWRCEPGKWHIVFGPAEQEVFTVLSGRCRVHDAAGGFKEARAGEAIHIPAGFTGAFEVLETMTKTYVTVDGDASVLSTSVPPMGRFARLWLATKDLWNEYTWVTRGATIALVVACLFGMLVAAAGDRGCLFTPERCVLPLSLQAALASDAFRTLITLAIALFVAIHLKERQIEGKLDGSQHYDIGRALAYGYFSNFLIPALLIVQGAGTDKQLQVICPSDVDDLESFKNKTWPLIKARTSTLSTDRAYQGRQDAPLKRSILVLSSLQGKQGAAVEYFDFPSTLFTLNDYYDSWNYWLEQQGKPLIPRGRIREMQQRQIGAFFGHLRELARSQVGLDAVREFGLTQKQLNDLFERHFRPVSPGELRVWLGIGG